MAIDYSSTERIVELSFGKLDKSSARLDFPKPGTLSLCFNKLVKDAGTTPPTLPHQNCAMLASAGVEMWHRSIHSFLWSLALTEGSPLWAAVSGYYASHFTMRAFAHSMGIFKSFTQKKEIQVVIQKGNFVCTLSNSQLGEHAFYWKAVKGKLYDNPLFHENNERDMKSDSAHRTFANYTDHVDSFAPMKLPALETVAESVEKISRIRLHSVTSPSREDFPDLQNVQILAFQRIVAFHDFLDTRVSKNRFWRAHRRPDWCKSVMLYQVDDQGLEQINVS
jgi:hypothetical protein